MGFLLIILFIFVPIIEISIFILMGQAIGIWPTILSVILTAIIGATFLKKQGLATWISAQENFNAGQFPLEDLFKGLCLIFAGILLITPGVFTDCIGFLCFVPSFRLLLKNIFSNMLVARNTTHVYTDVDEHREKKKSVKIIDGEFEEINKQTNPDT